MTKANGKKKNEKLDHQFSRDHQSMAPVSRVVTTLRTEQQYNKAVRLLDELIDKVSERPNWIH